MPVDSALLDRLFTDAPTFHAASTETDRADQVEKAVLPSVGAYIAAGEDANYGIDRGLASFIAGTVRAGDRTLETGAGSSTVVFAAAGAEHVAVSPSVEEHRRIRDYAASVGVEMAGVTFVGAASEDYLPTATGDLDFVLVDGKHAFPWPMIDWFFTAGRLRVGGVMVLDDSDMRSVAVLCDFLDMEPGWELVEAFPKAKGYRKVAAEVLDTSWHLQPWTCVGFGPAVASPSLLRRVVRRFR